MHCPGCFEIKGSKTVCANCKYDEGLKRSPLVLCHHTVLNGGHYEVGRLLGKPGGFGITYLGWDKRLQTKVAIKEYLPRELSGRDNDRHTVVAHSHDDVETFAFGLKKFLEEARTLAKLDHPNIVRVRDFFEENDTAYMVMDYYDGLTLSEYLALQPCSKLSEAQALAIIMPILDGLREVHAKGFLHRDIKPQNIYLTTGSRPILLDFGAARFAMGERSHSLTVVLSEGYAPIEQYQSNGKQGSWTDVYGAAATLYLMVSGQTPPNATDRVGSSFDIFSDIGPIDPVIVKALRKGLELNPVDRIQDIISFQAILSDQIEGYLKHPILEEVEGRKPSSPQPAPLVGYIWAASFSVLCLSIAAVLVNKYITIDENRVSHNTSNVRNVDVVTTMQGRNSTPASSPVYPAPPVIPPMTRPAPPPITPYRSPRQLGAIEDGERIKRLMLSHDGIWDADRYRKASYAFDAASQADSTRRAEWNDLRQYALRMARDLSPATTTPQLAPSVSTSPKRMSGPVADAERVQGKMRNQEGEWTAARYRKAVAAFEAAEKVDSKRRSLWQGEKLYALQMARTLEPTEPEPDPPVSLSSPRKARRLSTMAQKYLEDAGRVYQLMIEKDGDWDAERYRRAIAAFKAAAGVDAERKAQWQTAINYAKKMRDRLEKE